jgi:hypothetical protein
MSRLLPLATALLVFLPLCVGGCASLRLHWLEPFPAGEPLVGPEGSYQLTPETGHWVRIERNEDHDNIDLSLARNSGDAGLNVSVLQGRFPTPSLALAHARAQVDAMMTTISRLEVDVAISSPEGDLPGRMGVYCGTFDRELRSRDNCFVMLATLRGTVVYVLVGQVRVKDPEPGRQDELERLVLSLELIDPEAPTASSTSSPAPDPMP